MSTPKLNIEQSKASTSGRESPLEQTTPMHKQLSEKIRNQIFTGEYALGEKIPAEADLIAQYGISRITARRALQELITEGLLIGIKGKGTFVNPSSFTIAHTYLFIYGLEAGLDYPFTAMLLQGINKQNSESIEFRLEMLPLPPRTLQFDADDRVDELVSHAQIHGVIALPRLRTQTLERLVEKNIPVVQIGLSTPQPPPGVISIAIPSNTVNRLAIDHLQQRGWSQLGFIGQPTIQETADLVQPLCEYTAQKHIKFNKNAFEVGMWGINGGMAATERLLERHPKIDGIIASDDLQALGAVRAAEKAGRIIGKDIAVIGIGGMLGEHSHCGLTTVDLHLQECGTLAIECLRRLIRNEHVESICEITPKLTVRETS